jgi:hypothetical protein
MRYMLLICSDEKVEAQVPKAEMDAIVQGHMRFATELRESGKMVVGERLRPEAESSRIRLKAGQRQVMDGPFAETKEALGGFYLVEAKDLDEALDLAAQCPGAQFGSIEVRPVIDFSNAGAGQETVGASAG